ncbi:cbb3-type cytochrome c oxidase N-terminal domain-containing protein [Myroides marinus]|uniref:Cytochrome C oxidase subunit III n=1 Tax=Myroides marinus TaxID=703342 RepID=A0A163WMY5_9FLAO|nr:cbb3-type cytochrome c oxidase N-terminal domain-containing protein [Myroides marinus]KZE76568.1 cytochrome C oxidase subunit III [Myroides marinus]MDM1367920.1 c-type cytochrome [Myroides marinus]MDM1375301.1 c-type cytochrome [Myroides marinus]MDM1377582.1 c-type cytochrome [Myroides marinus]MDM1382493.1 c-type cytochrome [Myroides marinus]
MKKFFPVYVRVPLLFAIFFFAIEWIVRGDSDKPAFIEHPVVLILLGLFLFALIAVEMVASATSKIMDRLMTPEERAQKEKEASLPFAETPWVKRLMQKLTSTKTIAQEGDIMMDHDYDGIKELDNELPPWWVGLFYVTVIFAVIYLLRFHVFDGDSQVAEFEKEMIAAKEQVEEYKKTAPDMLTADQAVFSDDPAVLSAGKALFDTNCAVCHKPDGGGAIGPNLTDDHWILGGGMKNVFNTISEGGRPGKGMVPWKTNFKPSEIEKIASYVISLNGTVPAEAKAAEGDIIWSKSELSADKATEETPATEEAPATTDAEVAPEAAN